MDDLVESIAEAAHAGWMEAKQARGIESRRSESGEELMVPYGLLSEAAKDLDRTAVRSVLDALARARYRLVRWDPRDV